jgi:Flp pilus assembly protein TadD
LAIRRAIGDRHGEGVTLVTLGDALHDNGQVNDARESWCQALKIFNALRDPRAAEVRVRIETMDSDNRSAP